MNMTPEERAEKLLKKMSLSEKLYQITADMIFDVDSEYETNRNPLFGSYRNPGHFMHQDREKPADAAEVTERINKDVLTSISAQKNKIPPIENGEALHGAQWGMGTAFPQPIAMASSFDPEMVERVGEAIGKECRCVGVRQVFSPVVNVVRDCRWGRTVETYGEDVKLSCDMGAAMSGGLEKNGVISTPKHYVDNYSHGGRDSNYSETDERTLREVFLPPFKACIDSGAQSVMAAYNACDGIPCSANHHLLTEILRDEWGFKGFVVSDYNGVQGMADGHGYCRDASQAIGRAVEAGLDVILPFNSYDDAFKAYNSGDLSEEALNKSVLRILTAKFKLGLFDDPCNDPQKALETVRCEEHKLLALESARESIVLLKNEGVLPVDPGHIKKIGVFGQSAEEIPVGKNYSGPYRYEWTASDAPTPLEALREYLGSNAEIIVGDDDEIAEIAPKCDFCLYFTSIIEGEGSDRSDLTLPDVSVQKKNSYDGGFIVDDSRQVIRNNQEKSIIKMFEKNPRSAVILLNGAPIDMSSWIEKAGAVIEAWYPGEQGARALAEIVFGLVNPSAKLPISFPKNVGQLPLFYSHKPSGRGYSYCDNDGKPLFPFGYGLSYTDFAITGKDIKLADDVKLSYTIENTGDLRGTEVMQVYLSSKYCRTVRPVKKLVGYKRISLDAGEKISDEISVSFSEFYYYDEKMRYALHDGEHILLLGTSSEDISAEYHIKVTNGKFVL